jgi:hypothetical protein
VITQLDLEKIDSEKMFKVYDDWPEIAKNAYFKAETKFREPVKHIVFAGWVVQVQWEIFSQRSYLKQIYM